MRLPTRLVLARGPWGGMAAGLWGAGAVAVWFLIIDLIKGRPFYTPAALGSAMLLGAASPEEIDFRTTLIAAYTALHVVAFIAVGIALVWVAERVEQAPGWWLMAVMTFIVLDALVLGTVGIAAGWVLGALGWWSVAIANVVAACAMGWLISKTHPKLGKRLLTEPVETRV
jgi:hypothetical protein